MAESAERRPRAEDRAPEASPRSPVGPLERLAASLGLILTLAMLGVIGWQAFTTADHPAPAIVVEPTGVTQRGGIYVVEVDARNLSSSPAEDVPIEGVLSRDGRVVATGRATIGHLPGGSTRKAGLFFPEDPRRGRLSVRALGYSEP